MKADPALRMPLLLGLAALAWLLLAGGGAAHAQPTVLRSAMTVVSADSNPPTLPGQMLPLPDDWSRSRPGSGGPVWYRFSFDVDPRQTSAPDALRALFIERVCTNLAVFLNGRLIHSGGRPDAPIRHQCSHPQLVTMPAALMQPGANRLDVRVVGHALPAVGSRHRSGHLSAPEIGWHDELVHRHAVQTALKVQLPQAVGATLLLMGGFMFVMGFSQRRDSHLAYFGALSVGWALLDARLWLPSIAVDHSVAEFLLTALLSFITLTAVQFLLRYAGRRIHWVDVGLTLQCAVMPLSLVLAGPTRLYPMAMSWDLLFTVEVAAAAGVYLRSQWHRRQRSFWWMGALVVAVAAVGAIEFAMQLGGTRPALAPLVQLLPPVLFVIVGLRLVLQHGRALIEAEQGKAQLEQRIREATAEIESNFRQLAELRVEQVTERERKRIAGDLHDDLGAKLLTIVHTSDSERISTLAREALEEMRLSVRGLTGKPVQLIDALGDWRVEVVSRLSQAQIECEWSAPEDQELPQRLSARAYVQTTRILREATSNIIKHSGASRVIVRCAVADGDFLLIIQDNGNGISSDVELRLDRGHGLASMKARAKQLQGQCLVESGPGYGTVIRLTLPMDRATEAH